ncbi:hypothetical protein [Aquicoccus sp. SU-CL01552]|uniref:hypothetical protein n=1 Tax=Aquicoccus sp. SU-CL01552 TaxID=3127656 RepID=UPI0031052B14
MVQPTLFRFARRFAPIRTVLDRRQRSGYPNRDPRGVLEDLIARHGGKGKWFAAAKTAGYLDIALDCASDPEAVSATLTPAAPDFPDRDPAFAAQVALHAISHPLYGRGFGANPLHIDEVIDHVMASSRQINRTTWAMAEIKQMADRLAGDDFMSRRRRIMLSEIEATARGDCA